MCLAIQQMIDEATVGIRQESIQLGIEQGLEQELEKGLKQGLHEGKIYTLFDNIKNLMKNMHLSREECMEVLCVSEEDRKELNKLLK